jgi:predicted dienelactone hydrolase
MNRSRLLTVGPAFIRSMGLLLWLVLSLPSAALAQDWAAPGAFQVRVMPFPREMDASRGGRELPIKVHLPQGDGPFPVVIVSHGAGGNWDTHAGQNQHLASHGYVVLALEHVGSNTERLRRGGLRMMQTLMDMIVDREEVLGRPVDVSFAIDRAEEWNRSHPQLRGKLDVRHIGLMGHSFGAYTTMVVGGMRPALKWLQPARGEGDTLGPDLRDRRVSCGVALSPQGVAEPFFIEESFRSLSMPLLGISGTLDGQQGDHPAIGRLRAFALWPEDEGKHRFVWLNNARHLDFTSASEQRRLVAPTPTRADVQPLARVATLLFFEWHLKRDAGAGRMLTATGLTRYLRGAVDAVDVLSK